MSWSVIEAIPAELLALPAPLSFFMILRALKTTPRTGWVERKIAGPESIADHMYRMALFAFFAPAGLDKDRAIKIALVHDLAEAVVGDITPSDGISSDEKHRRETETMEYLADNVIGAYNAEAGAELKTLYGEYENQTSAEARFVKDLDKFEFLLQSIEYERDSPATVDLSDFLYARGLIKNPEVGRWADDVLALRKTFKP
ncbi:HD domain-containing protein, partial [Dipodascopsis tothii]|uniref:HD domain-containing protein n=1 Tax=Dipodascopsis tothii TaxID=44089 RepID=UPI0034CD5202